MMVSASNSARNKLSIEKKILKFAVLSLNCERTIMVVHDIFDTRSNMWRE